MDKVEVKVTWGLVWSFWWRMTVIGLAVYVVIGLPIMLAFGLFAALGTL
ncbi:MAG: hypothetical protein Q8Q07_00960 [Dehalococcoidales bacterium]|nr:hypothetical protein [Dehalococcoidales bacterium]